jgi:DNA-directed RNA polymerase subunit H (RpoH/RPB5)
MNSQKNSSSSFISKLHKSRGILLDILEKRGFDTEDYKYYGISEIQLMFNNKQLDMLLENKKNKKKIYIKYHLSTLNQQKIYEYIDDIYHLEEMLQPTDELLIIIKNQNINTTLEEIMNFVFIKDKIFVNVRKIKHYLFNHLDHIYVPPHRIMTKQEKKVHYEKYKITDDSQLPEISRFDATASIIGLRPGELCEITRPSTTSILSKYYRLCK